MSRLNHCACIIWMFLWNGVTCQRQQPPNTTALEWASHEAAVDGSYGLHTNDVHDTSPYNHRHREGIDECGGTFRDHQVLLKSPGYPTAYPSSLDCAYVFYSPFVCTSEFHIQFLDFQLEPSLRCAKDRLTIGSRTHRIDTLCGQVIGIMKYKVADGMLQINFTSDATVAASGFKLLVTRLPCVDQNDNDDDDGDKVGVKSTKSLATTTSTTSTTIEPPSHRVHVLPLFPAPTLSLTTTTTTTAPTTTKTTSSPRQIIDQSYAKSQPFEFRSNAGPLIAAEPLCTPSIHYQQQSGTPNQFPRPFSASTGVLRAPLLPNCCRNVYNQQRFTLISPGFPGSANYVNDCAFYVERAHANVCRLRIEFKYLNLGERQYYRCANSFVDIDGQQFCGCATGLVHYTQWGPGRKAIRFVNWPSYADRQGFVLSVVQEECPQRLQRRAPIGWRTVVATAQQRQNYQSHRYDPRRCSYDYVEWLLRAQPKLVSYAHAICHAR